MTAKTNILFMGYLLLLALFSATGCAERRVTEVGMTTLQKDTIWSGVVKVTGDVYVPPGVTLTIAPGSPSRRTGGPSTSSAARETSSNTARYSLPTTAFMLTEPPSAFPAASSAKTVSPSASRRKKKPPAYPGLAKRRT